MKHTSTNDPIADLLTRLRNGAQARHRFVDLPYSKMNLRIAEILREEGFLENVVVKKEGMLSVIRAGVKYDATRSSLFQGLKRVSSPGLRRYVGWSDIPLVLGGLGISIVSTSQGVLSGREARNRKCGGELICLVW